ncbi:hypothetical protein AB8H57_002743 [Vibrio parahaemolyticus]
MNISKKTMEALFDGNIRIENLFNMQLITACDSMPDSFWDVFDFNSQEVMETLGISCVGIPDLEDKSTLLEFLHDRRLSGFLIHFSMPVPRNFRFDENGQFSSCSSGWGWSICRFAFGSELNDALDQAIKIQEQYFEDCLSEARTELKCE